MAEDLLAKSLEKAAADPALKPEFGKALLASTIFVMGEIEGEDPTKRPRTEITAGSKVILRSHRAADGKTIVPFFSSLEKLQGFIEGKEYVSYLAIPARTLFEIARGSAVVLNPGSRVSGEFSAEDIAKLMGASAPPGRGGLN